MTTRKGKGKSDHVVQLPFMQSAVIYAMIEQADQTVVDSLHASARELGCSDEQITVYTDTVEWAIAPLVERKGYTALLQAISQGRTSVVCLHAQDHMFISANEYQVTMFIHLCMMKGILIVTPQAIYDMGNLAHIAKFRAVFVSAFETTDQETHA
jgi:hypothetical protein